MIDDLLILSAPLAWKWSPQLCHKDPATGADCSPAHGMWQYLRLMGLLGAFEPRRDFYLDAMQTITGAGGAPRVLISGAADYAMLDFVHTAFRARGVVANITVTDLCETPLALNRWYAERASCHIKTVRCDILEFVADAPFDAVCTDAFITRFPTSRRGALLEKWRGLMRPGGVVITATRLRPESDGEVRFSPEQVAKLHATVARVAREMRPSIGVDPDELAGRAAIYAARYVTHAVHTAEEIRALFEEHGFGVSHLSVENAAERGVHGASGPSIRGDGKRYLHVVAKRL